MNATTSPAAPDRADLDEVVQQLDHITADVGHMSRTLDRIRLLTTIIAIAAGIIILGFVIGFVVGFVGAFEASN